MLAVLIVGGVAFFKATSPTKPASSKNDPTAKSLSAQHPSPISERELSGPTKTKTKTRDTKQHPTPEETRKLLEETIIPSAEFENITFQEAVWKLNRLARDQGIPADKLTFTIPESVAAYPVDALHIQNHSMLTTLRSLTGRTLFRAHVEGGRVTFFRANGNVTQADESLPLNEDDPFRDLDSPPVPRQAPKPYDPTDTFSPADPFSER